MKPVIIIAIAFVLLFIVSSNPDAFAQVQVNAESYKNSHHIDESNYLIVKINKVIPNTDFCLQTSQNGNVETYFIPINSESDNKNWITGHTQKIPFSNDLKTGYYTAEVFYGNCSSNDSFGNDSTRILFDAEPSKRTKFIQDNYFPEKIDVGINHNKIGSWNYEKNPFLTQVHKCYTDLVCSYGLMDESISQVSQLWDVIEISIIQASSDYDDSIFSDDLEDREGREYDKESKFKCKIIQGSPRKYVKACMNNNIVVILEIKYPHKDQLDIFMGAIVDKINSNPIPSSSVLSSMYSSQDTSQDTSQSTVSELSRQSSSILCGAGTMEKNGQCVVNPNYDTRESLVPGSNFFDSLIEMFTSWFR